MITVHGFDELKTVKGDLCLALGVFDGVHVGHQAVITKAVERAKQLGCRAGVVTFSPHPIQVLAPDKAPRRILATLAHKEALLANLGIEVLIIIEFTSEFATQPASGFIDQLVSSCSSLCSIAVGEDWRFGRGREGDGAFLQTAGQSHHFAVDLIPPVIGEGERVSSTRIRQAIRDGNLDAIASMLGRPYSVMGKVLKGRQLGRTIGFPTANLDAQTEQLPPSGVWAVQANIDGTWTSGVANLGHRPTVEGENSQRLLEVHIFNYSGDLYEKNLEVRFFYYIRPEMVFSGIDMLKKQIAKDADISRDYFENLNE